MNTNYEKIELQIGKHGVIMYLICMFCIGCVVT